MASRWRTGRRGMLVTGVLVAGVPVYRRAGVSPGCQKMNVASGMGRAPVFFGSSADSTGDERRSTI